MKLFAITLGLLGLCAASPLVAGPEVGLEKRSGKPTGGPASAQVTIYSGPYTCANSNTAPPTDGSAGTVVSTFTIAETQCTVVNVPFGGAITAKLTATPKTGTLACYIQIYQESGCGLTITNAYHGFPFAGVTLGSPMSCGNPPLISYGAVSIVCG